jgi:hypothetical protein
MGYCQKTPQKLIFTLVLEIAQEVMGTPAFSFPKFAKIRANDLLSYAALFGCFTAQ